MMTKAEHSVHNEWFEWITKRQQPHLDLISKQLFVIKIVEFKYFPKEDLNTIY